MNTEQYVLDELMRFSPTITVSAKGVTSGFVKDLLRRHPKMGFYLSGVSMSYGGTPLRTLLTLQVRYRNTEVKPSDVYVLSDSSQVDALLCRYVGDYKKRLVLVLPKGLGVQEAYDRFMEVDAPFYPNFTRIRTTVYHFALCDFDAYSYEMEYRIGKVKLLMMEQRTDGEVERIARLLFLPDMPEEAKAYLAHNYLAHTVRFDAREDTSRLERSYIQSAYGALIVKKCVCQGYAEAYKRLLEFGGVECDVVCGQTEGSDTHHAWNIVMLHGREDNYHVDVTWDAASDRVSYTYFGLRDTPLDRERTWNRDYTPPCRSHRNLYMTARQYIINHRAELLRRGVDPMVLDC